MNAAILEHPFRLIEDVYNDIEFDCHPAFQPVNYSCQVCMDRTEKIRQDLLPHTEIMVERQLEKYEDECHKHLDNNGYTNEELAKLVTRLLEGVCSPYLDPDQDAEAKLMHPCMDNQRKEYLDAFFDHLDDMFDLITSTLRMPKCLLTSAIQEFHYGCNHFGSYDECQEAFNMQLDSIDDLCYALSMLDVITPKLRWPFRAGLPLKSDWRARGSTSSHAESLISILIDQSRIEMSYPCLLELVTRDISQDCRENITMSQLIHNMDVVYKLLRLVVPPISKVANEKSEQADAGKMREFLHYVHHYNMRNESIFNEYATIAACKYGNIPLSSECKLFSNVFSSSGIGYTFNSVPYWSMFRNTGSNFDFYKEMYETDNNIDDMLPRYIENTGQNFALDFIVRHNSYGYKCNCVTLYDQYQKVFLSLHDPAVVPNLKSDGLLIQPGYFYDIRVQPSVTLTDSSALALKPETRNCLSRDENENLLLYNIYSQSACIFECKLKEALKQCNCSNWDYPRIDPSAPLCLDAKEIDCFASVMEVDAQKYNCSCLNDCQYYTYDIDVHVTELLPRDNEALL